MKHLWVVLTCALCVQACGQQTNYRLIGGPCEGCEAVFDFGGMRLTSSDTLPLFEESSPKIKVSGTVFKPDGKTPAKDVILYLYQTNMDGIYPTRGDEVGWAEKHGYIRGWVKTDKNGKYSFYTFKPGTYPSRSAAAHIHVTVFEPNGKYYWLGSYLFEGDPLIREVNSTPRGGPGEVLSLKQEENLLVGSRDIILGENVPGYE